MEGALVGGLVAHVESELLFEDGIVETAREAFLLETESALEEPVVPHHVHDQEALGGSCRLVLGVEVVHESDKLAAVFRRQDAECAVEAMTEIVERRDGLAFGGARIGGRLSVGAIGIELGLGNGDSRLRGLRGGRIGFSGVVGQFPFFMFFGATDLTCCHARSFG